MNSSNSAVGPLQGGSLNPKKDGDLQEVPDPGFWVSTLRGLRNGMYYGGKIRFMHGIVMMILFRKGTWREAFKGVLENTWEHARNLGLYVFLYKSFVRILNKIRGKKSKYHSLLAGLVVGYFIFGNKTNINYQVVLYLLSRVIVGGVANLAKKYKKDKIQAYPWLTAFCWAIVMFLFDDDPSVLQASLKSSMDFLYKESDSYKSWADFVPFALPGPLETGINKLVSK